MAREKKPTDKRVTRRAKPKPANGTAKKSPTGKAKPAVKNAAAPSGPARIYMLDVSLLSGPISYPAAWRLFGYDGRSFG